MTEGFRNLGMKKGSLILLKRRGVKGAKSLGLRRAHYVRRRVQIQGQRALKLCSKTWDAGFNSLGMKKGLQTLLKRVEMKGAKSFSG